VYEKSINEKIRYGSLRNASGNTLCLAGVIITIESLKVSALLQQTQKSSSSNNKNNNKNVTTRSL
jgi:hypothetical protein